MGIKSTGAEFKAFWDDPDFWADGRYVDDEVLVVNGLASDYEAVVGLKDSDSVVIECGVICDEDGESEDLVRAFKAWRKKQNTAFLSIQCPKKLVEAVTLAVKAAGGKVN